MPGATAGPIDREQRCTATVHRTGERCKRWAIAGGTVCPSHGGRAPQVKAAAKRHLAETQAVRTLALVDVTPIGNPLEELAEIAAEQRAFMRHVADKVADLDGSYTGHNDAGTEHVRALVALYERAADRCGKLLAEWVRLGFDERMVGLHERQAELVADVIRAVLADPELGLTETQQATAPAVLGRHLAVVKDAA